MRRFHFTLLGVLSVFLLSLLCPSCRPQSDVEEATLELSATALTLPREGTAQTLTITTNQSSWSAFSPQEATWITLRQEGNTLYVGAQANASGQERTGAVLVQAGGLQRRVTVHQTAADVLLEAPESVVLQAEGGSSEVSSSAIAMPSPSSWPRVPLGFVSISARLRRSLSSQRPMPTSTTARLRSPSPQGRPSVSWRSPSWDSLPTSSPC